MLILGFLAIIAAFALFVGYVFSVCAIVEKVLVKDIFSPWFFPIAMITVFGIPS